MYNKARTIIHLNKYSTKRHLQAAFTCKLKIYHEKISEQNKYQNSYLFHKLCKNLQLVQSKNHNFHNTSQSSLKTQHHAILSIIYQKILSSEILF